MRISDSSWFRKEHREVDTATWKSPAVKSAANCGACHRQAEQGDFSERNLVVPRRESQ
jgi:nitrate/TMAO reductase-like tetraheme cytochrome c subunit